MKVNINDLSDIPISRMVDELQEKYHIDTRGLAQFVGSSERTILTYRSSSGDEGPRDKPILFRIQIFYRVWEVLARHIRRSDEIEKMLTKKKDELDNLSTLDLIRQANKEEPKLLNIALNLAVEKLIEEARQNEKASIDEFRERFGYFNEENCVKAAKLMPQLLVGIFEGSKLPPTARALALESLASAEDAYYLTFLKDAARKQTSPFIKEGAARGLYGIALQFEKHRQDISAFLSQWEERETYQGVRKTVSAILSDIEAMHLFED